MTETVSRQASRELDTVIDADRWAPHLIQYYYLIKYPRSHKLGGLPGGRDGTVFAVYSLCCRREHLTAIISEVGRDD